MIELDESDNFFKSNHKQGISDPFLVSYSSERRIINGPNEKFWNEHYGFELAYLKNIFEQKSIDWAYEEEVRVFRKLTMLTPSGHCCQKNFDIMLVDIPPTAISGIYLGANMEESIQDKIIYACKNNRLHIPIYKASLSHTSYSLEFQILTNT